MVSGRKPNLGLRAEVARLRATGLSLAEIGRRVGVTKQCVHWVLRTMGHKRSYSVPCAACRVVIPSAGALPTDAGAALCLRCLAQRPQAAFAQRLKAFRLAAGLTKAELAERAGLREQALRQYEDGGREPRWRQLVLLVRVLGPGLVTLGLAETG